jgi:hypothetical protein
MSNKSPVVIPVEPENNLMNKVTNFVQENKIIIITIIAVLIVSFLLYRFVFKEKVDAFLNLNQKTNSTLNTKEQFKEEVQNEEFEEEQNQEFEEDQNQDLEQEDQFQENLEEEQNQEFEEQ